MRYKIVYYEIITIIELIEYNTKIIKGQKPSPETARLLEVYTFRNVWLFCLSVYLSVYLLVSVCLLVCVSVGLLVDVLTFALSVPGKQAENGTTATKDHRVK